MMNRETENAVLLVIGSNIALITVTGVYTNYVKPSLLPWLVASAALLIVLALVAIVRDIRSRAAGDPEHDDDHDHGGSGDGHAHKSGIAWLLVVPIALLGFIIPPAITPQAAAPSAVEVSTDVLRRPFPPIPDERAPKLSLTDVLLRIAQDSANSLDGRLVTVSGFTLKEDSHTDLAQVVITCCAADAQLARIRLSGPVAQRIEAYPDNTWLSVEGKVPPEQRDLDWRSTPKIEVFTESRIDPPDNPYGY